MQAAQQIRQGGKDKQIVLGLDDNLTEYADQCTSPLGRGKCCLRWLRKATEISLAKCTSHNLIRKACAVTFTSSFKRLICRASE